MVEKQDTQKGSVISNFLSGNLRFLRRNLKLSQEELAGELSLNRGNIASYENGSAEPKICNLIKIAHFFRISVSDLTQHNLTCEVAAQNLPSRLQGLAPDEREKVDQLFQQSVDFRAFLKGIHSCYSYKINQLSKDSNSTKDVEVLKSYFEQLYEATDRISAEYQDLLNMCHCQAAKRDK